MWKVTWRDILSHKIRFFLTSLSIVLGVAFVAAAFIVSDMLNSSFETLITDLNQGTDVEVRSAKTSEAFGSTAREPLPEAAVEQVRAVPGVRAAEGTLDGERDFLDKDGEVVTSNGPPILAVSWTKTRELSQATIRTGRPPTGKQVAMDAVTAEKLGFRVGDTVTVLTTPQPTKYRLSGIFGFGQADNLLGAKVLAFDLPVAQEILQQEGEVNEVHVVAAEGVSPDELRSRIDRALPGEFSVVTGQQSTDELVKEVRDQLKFFSIFLLVFASIVVFVASFIIANTFSILVSQRTREFGLLRAVGASTGQVLRSMSVQTLVLAIFASTLGLACGIVLARLLPKMFQALGIDLPDTGTPLLARTVVWSFVVGVAVTLVAALWPARRASRISPLAALQEGFVSDARPIRRRVIGGIVVTTIGAGLLAVGLLVDFDAALQLTGFGCAVLFLGVTMLTPLTVRPLVRSLAAVRRILRIHGPAQRLAERNAMRDRRRTAATASALMIGLALVTATFVLTESLKKTLQQVFNDTLAADLILSRVNAGFDSGAQGVPGSLLESVAALPEVSHAGGMSAGTWDLDGETHQIRATTPDILDSLVRLRFVSGNAASFRGNVVMIDERVAEDRGLQVGDSLDVSFRRTGDSSMQVIAIYKRNQFADQFLIPQETFLANNDPDTPFVLGLVDLDPNVDAVKGQLAIANLLETRAPNIRAQSQIEFREEREEGINQVLALVTVLLALSVIVAAIGIVNTLALSVFERTREIGLLRAVGLSRRQARRMIRGEAVLTAVVGGILGVAVGLVLGISLVSALRSEGFTELALPGVTFLAPVLLVAALIGMLAAVFPARRAARLDVLKAVATE